MIPNMWYAVLESNEVKPGKPYGFKRMNEELVFWRDNEGKIVVMRDLCPHRQAKLSLGKVVDGNIQCHFHGFQFDRKGTCQLVPANGRNGPKPKIFQCWTYPVQEAHDFIWIWSGEPREEYPPIPFFEGLENHIYATFQKQWNTHYTRAVQGVLDVSHLPFVHAKTIGRDGKTLVNGPYTTLEDNQIQVWVSNQPDVGLPAIKPTEVPPPNTPAALRFKYPNVWQLWINDQLSQVAVFAPIDDENTMLYVRNYQRLIKNPILGRLFAQVGNIYNRYVLHEDEEIIVSQRPKKADLDVGERFIPGDRPIALYLKHRRDLILAAQQAETATEDAAEDVQHERFDAVPQAA
ncbi:MAG: aromatic ring-hydroxylating dioxygenase subunit alpha [Chloroflexales bacterium]|nr:aromatic ring-hydroxylating dioxygenase subunit alpha [Chloroflexales bacterium]